MDSLLTALRSVEERYQDVRVVTGKLRISDMAKDCANAIEKLQAENAQLRAELALVKAEREAAVEEIRHYPGITPCYCCKHKDEPISEKCRIEDRTCFEWRGLEGRA